jgi:AcrR family transcriptional regulator
MAGRAGKTHVEHWVGAAHELLLTEGPDAVTVEGAARLLSVTKGSFYHHFTSRAELLVAGLTRWHDEQTLAIIHAIDDESGPYEKLSMLFDAVAEQASARRGEVAIYAAAAAGDPHVALAVERVTHARIDFVAGLLVELGQTPEQAKDRARLALAMAVGQSQLSLAVPDTALKGRDRQRVTKLSLRLLTEP